MKNLTKRVLVLFAVVLCCLAVVAAEAAEMKQKKGKTSKESSEAAYKAACRKVTVADLTSNPNKYKGQKVTYTGQILVMDFPQKTATGTTPTGLIITVTDDSHVLPSGLLPVYVTYQGKTDSFIYDSVTIYGKVYGSFDYKSVTIKQKTLPRIDAKYLEKQQPAQK
ncbi:MAG: hypothetical protein EHM79_15200 [Geobacter sp.]|nr:MAG: hypothetical protein EHM79_15200 [Geobacter sp.]